MSGFSMRYWSNISSMSLVQLTSSNEDSDSINSLSKLLNSLDTLERFRPSFFNTYFKNLEAVSFLCLGFCIPLLLSCLIGSCCKSTLDCLQLALGYDGMVETIL